MYLGIANHGYSEGSRRIKSVITVAADRMPVTEDVSIQANWGKRRLSLWFYAAEFDAIARELGYERRPF